MKHVKVLLRLITVHDFSCYVRVCFVELIVWYIKILCGHKSLRDYFLPLLNTQNINMMYMHNGIVDVGFKIKQSPMCT